MIAIRFPLCIACMRRHHRVTHAHNTQNIQKSLRVSILSKFRNPVSDVNCKRLSSQTLQGYLITMHLNVFLNSREGLECGGYCRLQQTATDCNRLQQIATDCNRLQQTATDCNRLHHTTTNCITLSLPQTVSDCTTLHHTVTDCRELWPAAEHLQQENEYKQKSCRSQ